MHRLLLTLLVLLAPLTARADWREASTPHFLIYSQQNAERLRAFATNLERFDKGLRVLRRTSDEPIGKANRVTVYVVGDPDDVAELARSRRVAGFYQPRAGGSLAVIPRSSGSGSDVDLGPLAILLHEYSHHFMWTIGDGTAYPAWFVEGFAEFHATATFGKDGGMTFGEPPLYRGVGLMRGNLLPIGKLLVADTIKLSPAQMDALYGRGWLLTHYLMIGNPARNNQLGKYIDGINAGTPAIEAATAAFGDLRQLDRELERYKMGTLRITRLSGPALRIGEVSIRDLTPGEAATMKVRIRSKVGVNSKTAPGVYADARKAAAPYPNDAAAQVILAETAFDAADLDGALAAAERALAADPKLVDAYLYKARAQMALARKAGDRDKARWAAIRKIIIAANRLDTSNPKPPIEYFLSFSGSNEAPTQAAKLGLANALDLAPQDRGLRFLTAGVYLREGQMAQARFLLAPLAYQPHDRALAARARKLIALIDAGKPDAALTDLDGAPDEPEDTPES